MAGHGLITMLLVSTAFAVDQQALENAVLNQANEINTLKQQVASLQTALENSYNYLEQNIKKERLRPAFHVTFNSTTQTNVGDHEVLKFDTVVLNYGNGYDTNTGKFTAPVTGIYELSVHFEEAQGQYVYVNLMTEAGKVSYSVAGDPQWQNSASFTALVYLQQGQTAWVERDAGTATYVLNGLRSSFSGFLVRAD